jgi:hypothetical protein
VILDHFAALYLQLALAYRASIPTQNLLSKALPPSAYQVHHTRHELTLITPLEPGGGIFP